MADKYTKPFMTVAQQVATLKSRGLSIADEPLAIRQLQNIGYYRLSGYWYPYRIRVPVPTTNPKTLDAFTRLSNFKTGAIFDDVVRAYELDRRLKLMVLDGLERIEVAMRFQVGHTLGAGHPFAHLDLHKLSGGFTGVADPADTSTVHRWLTSEHSKWLTKVKRQEESSKEEFVKHFRSTYGGGLPVWVVTEILDFGGLSTLYAGLRQNERDAIAEHFGVGDDNRGDGAALVVWMTNLNYVRNICAHHARLWNRNIVVQGSDLRHVPDLVHAHSSRARIYASLAYVAYMLSRSQPESTWRGELAAFITKDASPLEQESMGFPDGWEAENIWNPSYCPMPDAITRQRRATRDQFECVGSTDIGRALYPHDNPKDASSNVRRLRLRSQLLALRVSDVGAFEYPIFQIDTATGQMNSIVAYANDRLAAAQNPWEAAQWWISPADGLAGESPLKRLERQELTSSDVDSCLVPNRADS
jgi:abortive infection bacteriophage resistance protein